jgi:phosphatidylglycerophosphatase B
MKKIVILFAFCWVCMVVVVFLPDVAFSAIAHDSIKSKVAILITETAGKIGTFLIVVITVLLYTRKMLRSRDILKTLIRSTFLLFILIGGFAFINENLTKKATKIIRPSLKYIHHMTNGDFNPEKLYISSDDQRTQIVMSAIASHKSNFDHVDRNVLNHWIDETGYSFPSGHTFNAFLLATIISFSLYHSRSKSVDQYYVIPPVWAMMVGISRVALGAHGPWDVFFGGALGMTAGLVFIHWDDLRHLVLHRKYNV